MPDHWLVFGWAVSARPSSTDTWLGLSMASLYPVPPWPRSFGPLNGGGRSPPSFQVVPQHPSEVTHLLVSRLVPANRSSKMSWALPYPAGGPMPACEVRPLRRPEADRAMP